VNYCTLTDVQGLITGFTITATSTVSQDTVNNEIIPMYSRYIDDRLGKYYQTPITGTNSLLTLNRIVKQLCAAEVVERVYIGQGPSDSIQSTTWRKQAEDDLTRLANGGIILTDAVPTGDTPQPMSVLIGDNLSQATRQTPPAFSMAQRF